MHSPNNTSLNPHLAKQTLSVYYNLIKNIKMKLTAFLFVAPALLAAALPTSDVLSEIERREASPVAGADPIYYSQSFAES